MSELNFTKNIYHVSSFCLLSIVFREKKKNIYIIFGAETAVGMERLYQINKMTAINQPCVCRREFAINHLVQALKSPSAKRKNPRNLIKKLTIWGHAHVTGLLFECGLQWQMCGGWVHAWDDESEIKVVYSQTSKPSTKTLAWESEERKCAATICKTPIRKKQTSKYNQPPSWSDCRTHIWFLLRATNTLID